MSSTLLQLRTKILEPIDSQEAISSDDDATYSVAEVNRYINEGIDSAEAIIHSIYEDYFLANEAIAIVSGTKKYGLPADIYATKIRKILFDDGSEDYIIRRIKQLEDVNTFESNDDYKYMLTNNLAEGIKLNVYPTPTFTDATTVVMYYIRQAKTLALDADMIDIPEFEKYVILYARRECLKKQIGNPILEYTVKELKDEEILMVGTLATKVPDEDANLELDTSFYDDFYNTGNI